MDQFWSLCWISVSWTWREWSNDLHERDKMTAEFWGTHVHLFFGWNWIIKYFDFYTFFGWPTQTHEPKVSCDPSYTCLVYTSQGYNWTHKANHTTHFCALGWSSWSGIWHQELKCTGTWYRTMHLYPICIHMYMYTCTCNC